MLHTQKLPFNIFRGHAADETNGDVQGTAERFRARFDSTGATVAQRQKEALTMVNEYYDLVTDFYEYGWGQAFHFAPRYEGENFHESLARHEYFLAARGGFGPKDRILDIGCGVGGPLRNIARFTGSEVVGLNNNEYQISRGIKYNARIGLTTASYVKGDFNATPFGNEEFDGAYAIEATCHSANRTVTFSEIFRVLKPGAAFVGYEWVVTKKYDAQNAEHRRIKHGIELGDALPDLATAEDVINALKAAGFEVDECYDMCEKFESGSIKNIPWYQPLAGSYTNPWQFKSTHLGRWVTSTMVNIFEKLHIAPQGSVKTAAVLEEAAVNLVKGGELGIFTPALYFRARKPAKAGAAVTSTSKKEKAKDKAAAAAAATAATPASSASSENVSSN